MRLRNTVVLIGLVVLLGFSAAITSAQGETPGSCPVIVQEAINVTGQACSGAGRNQACYGNIRLAAEPRDDAEVFTFEQTGDTVNLLDIRSLSLSPMDQQAGEWGVALMRVQANLPETLPGQNVTFLLFGDTEIRSAVRSSAPVTPEATAEATAEATPEPEPITLDATVQSSQNVNVRSLPSTSGTIVQVFSPGTVITAIGRTADSAWINVELEGGQTGWISAQLVVIDGETATLAVTDGSGQQTAPAAPENVLSAGIPVEGSIDAAGTPVVYLFDALEGDALDIELEVTGGDLVPQVEILDPAGNPLTIGRPTEADGRISVALSGLALPQDGQYQIVAGSWEDYGLSSGSYSLRVDFNPALSFRRPMQAFYFRSGIADAQCEEAPDSGLLIQTPEGAGEIFLLVNEVRVQLGSTAYLQSQAEATLDIYLIEGAGRAEAFDEAQFIPAGTVVSVPLDADLAASGPPGEPQPYDQTALASLPIAGLEQPITIAEPLAESEILTGDVAINLTWDNGADMDIWLVEPDGAIIYYGNPSSISGAQLDQDTNAACESNFGNQENITWPTGQPRLGVHTLWVREWSDCGYGTATWTLTVTIGETVVLQETGQGEAEFSFER